ncbi:hypothetical protein PtB15_6B480 [Puccinia triticina]|nr:hypothetical protein PtB15_6B480 [Puccinia triticina]
MSKHGEVINQDSIERATSPQEYGHSLAHKGLSAGPSAPHRMMATKGNDDGRAVRELHAPDISALWPYPLLPSPNGRACADVPQWLDDGAVLDMGYMGNMDPGAAYPSAFQPHPFPRGPHQIPQWKKPVDEFNRPPNAAFNPAAAAAANPPRMALVAYDPRLKTVIAYNDLDTPAGHEVVFNY